MKLRTWQAECISQAINNYRLGQSHFLCLATPGAGKTVMASVLADSLFKADMIDLVICFSPSVVVAEDFKEELERFTGKRLNGSLGAAGSSITYQGMLTLGQEFWGLLDEYRVFVIFDEIHHCAGTAMEQTNTWGERIIAQIQGRATHTLALTGTPWRSDQRPISLARYCNKKNQVQCDYHYGLNHAISEGVCRTPAFTVVDNDKVQFQLNGDSKRYDSFKALLEDSDCNYQELLESRDLIHYCLAQANTKLEQLRRNNPEAGGLIVATSVAHASKIHRILATEFSEQADMVTHKEENALSILRDFKYAQRKWIISVGMISEGTNIPRLQVCCHLTRVKTELYFRQVLGRILRSRGLRNENGYLFMPAEPTLVEYAKRVAKDIPETAIVQQKPPPIPNSAIEEKIQPTARYEAHRQGEYITLGSTKGLSHVNPIKLVSISGREKTPNAPQDRTLLSSNYMSELNIAGKFSRKRLLIGKV